MLNLTANEVKVVQAWSEHGHASPFPQEISLLKRLRRNVSNRIMSFTAKELQVILYWAEHETKGHYGTAERYLLEPEAQLLEKIENYLNTLNE
jgi:hypothetical protein